MGNEAKPCVSIWLGVYGIGTGSGILNAIDLRRQYKSREPIERKRVFQMYWYFASLYTL